MESPVTPAMVSADVQTRKKKIQCKQELIISSLQRFYAGRNDLPEIVELLKGTSDISLRLVDWFVTNYAKKNYTTYAIEDPSYGSKRFKVYVDYKLKLKAYSKARLDPFCRWERISIPYKGDTSIETTIGQLNFFKWALENKIIEYIENNYDTIEKDMNSRNSTSKRKEMSSENSKTRKKREELSISATKSIKKEKVEIVVQFN